MVCMLEDLGLGKLGTAGRVGPWPAGRSWGWGRSLVVGTPPLFLASRHSASQSGIKSPPPSTHSSGRVSQQSVHISKNALSFRGKKKTPSSWKDRALPSSLGSSATPGHSAAPSSVTQPQSPNQEPGTPGERTVRIAAAGEVSGRAGCAHTVARPGTAQNWKEFFPRVAAGLASGDPRSSQSSTLNPFPG